MFRLDRRLFLKCAGAAVSSGVLRSQVRGAVGGTGPNLVFVFPDQFRAQAMGFMRSDPVVTPHLDRFSKESRILTNAVSNRPLCSPYRGMLMTGRWPYSTGITTNCNSSEPDVFLRESECTFTDVLADAGYSVGYIGKWHLDTPDVPIPADDWRTAVWDCYTPPGKRRHGISFWYSYGCSDHHLNPHYWIQEGPASEKCFPGEYSVEHEAKVACSYILNANKKHREADRPFALFVAMNPPHPPYEKVPDSYRRCYADKTGQELLSRPNVKGKAGPQHVRNYFAAVTAVDQAFGLIMEALQKAGLENDTIVVFTSDHGEMMGSHGRMQKVVPYEESLRIPFMIRWPGRVKSGIETLHLNVPDTMPSLLSLMGLKERIPSQVEGNDYSAAFAGKQVCQRPTSTFYLRCGLTDDGEARGVRTDRYTFVAELRDGKIVNTLYDNRQDPYQMKNVASASPDVVAMLEKELKQWLTRTTDPLAAEFIS